MARTTSYAHWFSSLAEDPLHTLSWHHGSRRSHHRCPECWRRLRSLAGAAGLQGDTGPGSWRWREHDSSLHGGDRRWSRRSRGRLAPLPIPVHGEGRQTARYAGGGAGYGPRGRRRRAGARGPSRPCFRWRPLVRRPNDLRRPRPPSRWRVCRAWCSSPFRFTWRASRR